jgi:putative membrane protein
MLAQSGLFEIVEALVAEIVSPELGAAYLGMQGDQWDAQKDMLAAFAGALLCMVVLLVCARFGWTADFGSRGRRGRPA